MVVGSSPAVLNMFPQWKVKSLNIKPQINFQWLLLYKHLHILILSNSPNINNLFHFFLTNRTLKTYFQLPLVPTSNHLTFQKPILNRNLNFKTYFKTPTVHNKKFLKPTLYSQNTFYNLFLLYLQHTTLNATQFFTPHSNFQTLFIFSANKTTCYLNIAKMTTRWTHLSTLLINLFFVNTTISLFTTRTLKNEALSFNWSSNVFNYTLFRYSSPIFFLKDTTFGIHSTLIFKKFQQRGLNTVFLTDLKYHEKNLYYFKRFNMTTIGLVPYNLNPWLVTYAIPTSSNSLFIQYFFIKLLLYFKQYTLQIQFANYKQLW